LRCPIVPQHSTAPCRALQPDWSRLHNLRNQVIPETDARVTQLAEKATQEAEAAGALQNERGTVQKRVEVGIEPQLALSSLPCLHIAVDEGCPGVGDVRNRLASMLKQFSS